MIAGTVIKSTGSWYSVKLDEGGEILQCRIAGKFRMHGLKLTNPVAVGDRVGCIMEGEVGTIKTIEDRKNYVIRESPRKNHHLHLIASNIDQAILIVTIVQPKIKQGFIDRFLLMTEPYNIPVIIIFNKSDLYDEDAMTLYTYYQAVYESIGYQTLLTSSVTGDGVEDLKLLLKDKTSLVSGQSGVGKSSIINHIQGDLGLKTLEISDYSGKGQHTTTFAEMFSLEDGGNIIDTPGIKTLSFNHLEILDVAHNFREFFVLSEDCKFANCTHRNEPKCEVKKMLEEGAISVMRYQNYLTLLGEVEGQNYWERNKDY